MRRVEARSESGASAVEFALVAPLLFMLVFGIISFGIAFMQLQTLRGAVREGGRAAAVGASVSKIQSQTANASLGIIAGSDVTVVPIGGAGTSPCNPSNVGSDVTVAFDTKVLPGGGIQVTIPFLPQISLHPVISSTFRCEV